VWLNVIDLGTDGLVCRYFKDDKYTVHGAIVAVIVVAAVAGTVAETTESTHSEWGTDSGLEFKHPHTCDRMTASISACQ